MLLVEIINQFRQQNGASRVLNWNQVVSNYCTEHCWAMAGRNELYHTEPCYLGNWSEIIAETYFDTDYKTTFQKLIYDIVGKSSEHREILLRSNELAYGVMHFKCKVYLCIRGR